jgi:hypothetical protein
LVRRGVIMTVGRDEISPAPVKQTAADEFASLPLARAYIDTIREAIGSLSSPELVEALQRLHRAYDEFPELELDRPRREFSFGLRSAAKHAPDCVLIPLLTHIVAFDPSSLSLVTLLLEKILESQNWQSLLPILRSLNPSSELNWPAIETVVGVLQKRGQEGIILQVVAELLERLNLAEEDDAADFGDVLVGLLSDEPARGIDSSALARAARSARRRANLPPHGRNRQESRDALLAMAQRLRIAPTPLRFDPSPDLGWPSGRMSFDEFLLQWPCEVELSAARNDKALIEEAFRAILLREPDAAELNQCLRLLESHAVSMRWIIEDLLGSEELRSLERRVRVIWRGQVITEPGWSEAEEMPAVTWPQKSAD